MLRGRRPILVVFVLDRHRVDTLEPAIEVDVGAAPAAERPEFFHGRLAAGRAGSGAGTLGAFGHAVHMVTGVVGVSIMSPVHHTALSQPKRIG